MKKPILIAVIAVLSRTALSAQSGCNSLRYQDTIFHAVTQIDSLYFGSAMPYGSTTPQDLYLDIYEPANDTCTLRPLIVYQFGGGFVIGWREEPDIPQYCTYFAQCGYVCATIDYRIGLDPLDTGSTVRAFYRGVQDERSAIRYLCQNWEQFRIDTSRIILTGTSAGCFCAFANVYMNDSLRPVPTYGTTLEPADMGCMDCSGNNDYGHRIPRIFSIFNMWGAILDTNYILNRLGVPTISFQGTLDIIVPYVYGYPFQLPVFPPVYGAVPINQRQTNQGILNVLHPLVGYSHEPELTAPWLNDTIYNYGRRFLWPLLKPNTPAITGDSTACTGGPVTYSVINTPGSWYCWQINGNAANVINDAGNTLSVTWPDTGMVSVSVTEFNDIDAMGDTQSFQTHVIGHTHPAFTEAASQLQVTLTNTSTGEADNYWTFGNGDTSTTASPLENYTAPGAYRIELYTSNGYCADSTGKNITVDTCPVAQFSVQVAGMNAFFVVDTTNTVQYSLNFGDGDSVATPATRLLHQYTQQGAYVITLKVINKLGCISYDTLHVTVPSTTGINGAAANTASILCNAGGCRISFTGSYMNLQVIDITGRRVFDQPVTDNYYFETAPLAQGIYLLKVSDASSVAVRKIIKQ